MLHDLGQGLATLALLTDGLRNDFTPSGQARDRLDLMDQELSRLVDLAGLSAGEPVFEVFDVRRMLRQLISPRALTVEPVVTLRAGGTVPLCTDRGLLWRMVANLVDNAVRAAGPGGTVEVGVAHGSEVIVEVLDDGPGPDSGPPGAASQGIGIVTELARRCGARLQIRSAESGGTRARLVFSGAGQVREA